LTTLSIVITNVPPQRTSHKPKPLGVSAIEFALFLDPIARLPAWGCACPFGDHIQAAIPGDAQTLQTANAGRSLKWLASIVFAMAERPEGAVYQWRKIPPRELSIDLVDERLVRATARAGAS
jgi:hypothetical protein